MYCGGVLIMSKELKVFNGTTAIPSNSSVTVYTVPSGRAAKLEISSLNCYIPSFTGNSFSFGLDTFSFLSNTLSVSFPNVDISYNYSNFGSENAILGIMRFNQNIPTPDIKFTIKQTYYLKSGEAFILTNANYVIHPSYDGTVTYNFSVVEEY